MNTAALRTLVIYAITLPLAIFVGWMVAGDITRGSFAALASIVFFLLLPVILKWHYPVLVFSWNSFITLFFLPGQPALWMLMSALNVGIAVLHRILLKRQAFLPAPSVTISLLAFAVVVVLTARLRGGIGLSILGSSVMGGKGYVYILFAIMGYFALVSQPIPPARAKFYIGLFFLPGLVSAVSNLIYFAGPTFYFLYLVFPTAFASVQASSEGGSIPRIAGFSAAATTVSFYLLAVNGIRGLFLKWWRGPLLVAVLALGTLGGFRSLVVLMGIIFVMLFLVEGLVRSWMFPALILVAGLGFAALIPLTAQLPLSVQRTLSVLPLRVDPAARVDAEASTAWRKRMWQALAPDLPRYFWLGKGYVLNATDLYLTQEAIRYHRAPDYAGALLTGTYHNGPLSVYMPFGFFGSLAFAVFLVVSLRALYRNYRFGEESLRTINRFLFAYFLGRMIFFLLGFGDLNGELYIFTGAVGLSVALNKGICQKPAIMTPRPVLLRGPLGVPAAQPGAA